jgi:hypothetical protein
MKFPSVEVNTKSSKYIIYLFNKIFGEENAIEYIEDQREDGIICVHFNQSLPMTPDIEKFYQAMKDTGEIKIN